ncbi:MAG TPA: hypothetical protein VID50_08040 [Candidatus Eisenbacteria bacterium]
MFLGHFAVYGTLALVLYNAGVFYQYNVFFDTDPPRYLGAFAHGWQRPDWIHSIPSAISFPIRAIAALLGRLPGFGDPVRTRELLALGIAPLTGAGYALLLYSIGRVLDLERRAAAALLLLSSTSVAGVVFFSTPESYGLSALVALAACWLALRSLRRGERPPYGKWAILTAAAGAVTITEAASVALLYAAVQYTRSRRLRSTVLRAVGLVLLAVLLCGLGGAGIRRVYRYPGGGAADAEPGLLQQAVTFQSEFAPRDLGAQLLEVAALPVMTVLAPEPRWIRYDAAVERQWRHQHRFTFAGVRPIILALAALSLALAALAGWHLLRPGTGFRSDPVAQTGGLACLGIGVAQSALHLVFGREPFLYAMHFQPMVLVLIALALRRARPGSGPFVASGLVALAALNVVIVSRMLRLLI